MKKLLLLISLSFLPLTAAQPNVRPDRELPAWLVNTYHYGVSPITTALVLLARAGWWGISTTAQGVWNTGKFIYNEPAAACVVIPINLFIAYMLYKEGKKGYRYSKRAFDVWLEELRAWLDEQ